MNLLFSSKTSPETPQSAAGSSVDKKQVQTSSSTLSLVNNKGKGKGRKGRKGRAAGSKFSSQLLSARRAWKGDMKRPDKPLTVTISSEMAGSLVSANQEYEFRLVNSGSITASSGIWAGAIKFDPTSAAEWSSFDALFNEYKVVGAKITWIPYFNSSGSTELGTSGPYIVCGSNMGAFGTNPTSVANCMECSNAKVIYLSPGGPHSQYQLDVKVNDLQWQIIGSAGTPYAGAYGQFSVYGGDFYSSTNIISYVFELAVRMRARS